jgi:RND family efflux transporter MFP subunit
MTLVFAQLFTSLSVRSRTPIWRESLFSNVALLVVIAVSIFVQTSIQQSEFLAGLLRTTPVPLEDVWRLLAVAVTPLVALELLKFLQSRAEGETTGHEAKLIRAAAIGVFAIMAVGGSSLYWSWRKTPGIQSVSRREESRPATRSVAAAGVVGAESVATVTAPISGVVEALYCDVGAQVRAGQLCARIDPGPYRNALARAKADLDAAQKKYEEDRVEATRAKAALERRQALAKRRAGVRRELDRYRSAYVRAVAKAKNDEALIAEREAALRAAEKELDKTNVFSPVDGTVASRPVETGGRVEEDTQTPLFVVALPEARIKARVAEKDVAAMEIGRQVSIAVDKFPGRVFEGRVEAIRPSPETRPDAKTYDVIVSAPNPQALLAPQMTATVRAAFPPGR